MFRLVVRRIYNSIPTLIAISILSFGMIRLVPGDPVLIMLGERGGSPELVQEMRAQLGLDQPLWKQYLLFISRAVVGDLGTSMVSRRPVTEEFFDRFPATIELGLCAIILAVLFGLPMGVWAAVRRNSWWDRILMGAALVGYSMPIFWWGLVLILFFSVGLGWTPVSGRFDVMYDVEPVTGFFLIDVWMTGEPWKAFLSALRHLILPAVALGTIPLAAVARMTRSSLLEVLKEDFIRTARAKGVHDLRIYGWHALYNALIPIVTVIGLMVGTVLTGAILTETIFAWPGIGRWIVNSVEARDYPVIQGGVLLISITVILVNICVDALYVLINPLMRES